MDIDAGKIEDPDLRQFAADDTGEPRSVIVELDAAPADIRPRGALPRRQLPQGPESSGETTAGGNADTEAMNTLEQQLARLGVNLVRLNAAHAFVVTLSPAQLRAICRLPGVAIVRPNRTHRVPARP